VPPPSATEELDPGYIGRAQDLIGTALGKARQTKMGAPAKAWFKEKFPEGGWKADAAVLAVNIGIGVGITLAVAGVTAAGVATAAATFGVGPALAIVTAIIVAKSRQEILYSLGSKSLKAGMVARDKTGKPLPGKGTVPDASKDEVYGLTDDKSLLAPGVAKVLKKFSRVERRAAQVFVPAFTGAQSKPVAFVKGVAAALRDPWTDIKGDIKHQLHKKEILHFPGLPASAPFNDYELNQRLFELRFYGQLLYNYVHDLLKECVNKRNLTARFCEEHLFPRIVRQVKIAPWGHHDKCEQKNCFGLTKEALDARIKELEAAGKIEVVEKPPASVVNRIMQATAVPFLTPMNVDEIQSSLKAIHNAAAVKEDELLPKALKAAILPQPVAGDVSALGTSLDTGQGTGVGVAAGLAQKPLEHALQQGVTHASQVAAGYGSTAVAGAAGAVGAAPASYLLGEIFNLVNNKYAEYKVLQTRDTIINLSSEVKAHRDQAVDELKQVLKKNDLDDIAPRVAAKCAAYHEKLDELQKKLELIPGTANVAAEDSGFARCEDAFASAKVALSLMLNYEKYITYLVFLSATLLQLDIRACQLVRLPEGSLIKEGAKTPEKPVWLEMPS
jgi:hypothetical protein